MLVAIASDLHDNLNNWQKLIKHLQRLNISTLLLAGDLGNQETLNYISKSFSGKIFIVRGNADLYSDKNFPISPKIQYLGQTGKIKLSNLKIGLTHEPWSAKALLKKYPDLNFIFYGHTHSPWLEKINNCYLINPGNLTDNYLATFAYLDTTDGQVYLKSLINN